MKQRRQRLSLAYAIGTAFIATLGLTACQTTAQNDAPKWVEVQGAQVENIRLYVDDNHITPSAENPAWRDAYILNQQADAQENSESVVLSVTINCNERQMRVNEVNAYSQSYGRGDVTGSGSGSPEFLPAPPEDVVGNALVDAVCK